MYFPSVHRVKIVFLYKQRILLKIIQTVYDVNVRRNQKLFGLPKTQPTPPGFMVMFILIRMGTYLQPWRKNHPFYFCCDYLSFLPSPPSKRAFILCVCLPYAFLKSQEVTKQLFLPYCFPYSYIDYKPLCDSWGSNNLFYEGLDNNGSDTVSYLLYPPVLLNLGSGQ